MSKALSKIIAGQNGWVSVEDLKAHSNNPGKDLLVLFKSGDAVPYGTTHVHDTSFLPEPTKEILVAVRDGYKTSAEISQRTGKAQKTVNTHLKKLADLSFITREQVDSSSPAISLYQIPEHYAPKRDHKKDLKKVFEPKKKSSPAPEVHSVNNTFSVDVDLDATPLGLVQVIELLTQELKLAHEELERLRG